MTPLFIHASSADKVLWKPLFVTAWGFLSCRTRPGRAQCTCEHIIRTREALRGAGGVRRGVARGAFVGEGGAGCVRAAFVEVAEGFPSRGGYGSQIWQE